MDFEEVKAKLHDYIEDGDMAKIMAMYILLIDDPDNGHVVYDEATLRVLETRKEEMINGEAKIYTLEQTIENLKRYRSKYAT